MPGAQSNGYTGCLWNLGQNLYVSGQVDFFDFIKVSSKLERIQVGGLHLAEKYKCFDVPIKLWKQTALQPL